MSSTCLQGIYSDGNKATEHPVIEDPVRRSNNFLSIVTLCQKTVHDAWGKYKDAFWKAVYVLLVLGYAVYFGLAMNYEFGSEASIRLLWVTCLVVFCFIIWLVSKYFGTRIFQAFSCCANFMDVHNSAISW
jgi:hypothetical protein